MEPGVEGGFNNPSYDHDDDDVYFIPTSSSTPAIPGMPQRVVKELETRSKNMRRVDGLKLLMKRHLLVEERSYIYFPSLKKIH